MPLRSQPIRELCSAPGDTGGERCAAAADERCPRCDAPLCPRHVPPPAERCADCEAEFELHAPEPASLLRRERALVLGPAVIGAAIAVISGAVPRQHAIVFFIAIVGGVAWLRMLTHLSDPDRPGLIGWMERRRRRAFLEERRPRALTAGAPRISP